MKHFKIIFISNIIGTLLTSNILRASAQAATANGFGYSEEEVKIIVIALFVIVLIVFFFICAGVIIFSQDKQKREFASSTITGLNGFFIGAITGWLA